jgi:hypothetical protein
MHVFKYKFFFATFWGRKSGRSFGMSLLNHRLAVALVSAFFSAASLPAAGVTFVRVWPAYRTAESFERISEYFTGRENAGGQTVLRSQPDRRDGFYFLVRLKNAGDAVAGAALELSVITPASATPRVFTYPTAVPMGEHVFECGLTGRDWPGAKIHPVAWRLVVRAPGGAELARDESFMWAKPEAGVKVPE